MGRLHRRPGRMRVEVRPGRPGCARGKTWGGVVEALRAVDPTRIGPFPLLARLGEGGMGVVYLARTVEGRAVALKTVRADMANAPGFRQRFAREVRACRAVSGPGMVKVIDFDTGGNLPWLATEYVPGPSLGAAVDVHGPLPEDSLRRLLGGLARGLVRVHSAGLVHRDVKPTNVLLAPEGPLLIDFGIARAADETALTGTGMVIGSPGYMPPEQAVGRTVEAAGDVFSLGAVVAYAATGRGPFGTGAVHELLYRLVHEEPDLAGLPPGLVETVRRMLAKDARHRPSAEELAAVDGAEGGNWLPEAVSADITRQRGRLRALQAAAATLVVNPAHSVNPAPGPALEPAPTRIDPARPVSPAPSPRAAPPVRRMSRRALLGTGIVGCSALVGGAWALVRAQDREGGASGGKALREPSWSYTHDAEIVTPPAPGRRTVAFGDARGRIVLVSQNSHALQWAVDLRTYAGAGTVSEAVPIVLPVGVDRIRRGDQDVVLALTGDATLHGLSQESGERLWTRTFHGDTARLLPQVGGGHFVVASGYGRSLGKVTVMNAAGVVLLETDPPDSSLAWDEGDAVALYSLAGDWDGPGRRTVSVPDGKTSRLRKLPDGLASAAIEADGCLYFHTRRGVACEPVDPSDVSGWEFTSDADSVVVDRDPPVVQGGTVIFRYGEAVYATAGPDDPLWKFVADGQITGRVSSLARGGDEESLLFFGTDKATVYALNGRSGKVVWQHTAPGGPLHGPVPHGDSVYVAQERTLTVLDSAGPRWKS
ncbi:protein kinase [Streptomyces sp. NPDC093600]|uniref:protein kinase domain-containing protein n=1 Tax=Streptomyces sp. NPDC093600 TaxID=3366047 RepID=UPI0037F31DCB